MATATATKIELWPIKRLKPYARNARTHSPEQVEKIAASIVSYGFNNPILVDSNDGIIAGHGRLAAAQSLDLESVPVIVLDHLNEEQRRAYVLADNRLAELAQWDEDLLADELQELQALDLDLEDIGWSVDELAELTGDLENIAEEGFSDVADESDSETREFRLTFELDDFIELSDKLEDLQKRWKLESAEEVFSHLVRGA